MNEGIKYMITYGLAVLGGVTSALLFLLGLYGIMGGFFHEICKRIKKHNANED